MGTIVSKIKKHSEPSRTQDLGSDYVKIDSSPPKTGELGQKSVTLPDVSDIPNNFDIEHRQQLVRSANVDIPAPAPCLMRVKGVNEETDGVRAKARNKVAVSVTSVAPTALLVVHLAGVSMFCDNAYTKLMVQAYLKQLGYTEEDYAQAEKHFNGYPPEIKLQLAQAMYWRKSKMYEECQAVLGTGHYKQMVLFADGINPMVVALATKYPKVNFYCTDFNPEVVKKREEIFKHLQIGNVHTCFHDVNERGTLRLVLQSRGFDPLKKTYMTAEGLSYYLTKEAEHAFYLEALMLNNRERAQLDSKGNLTTVLTPSENKLLVDFMDATALSKETPVTKNHNTLQEVGKELGLELPFRYVSQKEYAVDYAGLSVNFPSKVLSMSPDHPKNNPTLYLQDDFPYRLAEFTLQAPTTQVMQPLLAEAEDV